MKEIESSNSKINSNNLLIIGTSHIAKESVNEVKANFLEFKPDIVAIELDKGRLIALLDTNRKKPKPLQIIKEVGFKGYLFSVIGEWAEHKLGKVVGVKPGADMLQAVKLARINNVPIALIDKDIRLVLKKISKEFTFKEKWTFFSEIVKGLIFKKAPVKFDLNTVPDKKVIKIMIGHVKKMYPSIYRILIDERNHYMASKLKIILKEKPESKIMAVVGAGHEEEILKLLKIA